MKKLRQTLAIVLAVVLLLGAIPFSANAVSTAGAGFSVSSVNGVAFNPDTDVIRSGDTIKVAITLRRSASELIYAWQLGYTFDQSALTYGGVTYRTPEWQSWTPAASGAYQSVGGMIDYDYVAGYNQIFGTEITVAEITFVIGSNFTGNVNIVANQGGEDANALTVEDENGIDTKYITAEGCSFTVLEKTDKSLLKAELDRYAEMDEDDYTPSSWSAVTQALPEAQSTYDNVAASQAQIDEATAALKNALDVLKEVAQKENLRKAIKAAQTEAAKSYLYTADSIQALKALITAAQAVYSNGDASQEEVDAAYDTIKDPLTILVFNEVNVIYLMPNGTDVYKSFKVQYGSDITPIEDYPEKDADQINTYTFDHWDGNFTGITETTYITPVYNSQKIPYYVSFYNDDGTFIVTQTYHYGDTITPPEDPEKPADAQYTYVFNGWDSLPETVTANVDCYATYTNILNSYTITFLNWDGSLIEEKDWAYGSTPKLESDPVREQDAQFTYTFAGWEEGAVESVTGPATYTAKFSTSVNKYQIIFLDEDGTPIGETQQLDYGDPIVVPENPTKASDEMYDYTFSGWSPSAPAETVTGNATYTATYSSQKRVYHVTFKNEDGSVYGEVISGNYGDTFELPTPPVKENTAQYTYTFAGWNPQEVSTTITGDAEYTATFTSSVNKYTITFINGDGTVLEAKEWEYGAKPAPETDPTKAATAQYTYTFSGWEEGDIVEVTGDATYTSKFDSTVNKYTVTFYNGESVFAEVEYEYGAVPTAPEGTPAKDSDATYDYAFETWTPAFEAVTGPGASYAAKFTPIMKDADYSKLAAAIQAAGAYKQADYTSVSYGRLFDALVDAAADENQNLKIDKQSVVDGLKAAINEAIAKLVSDNAYKALYAEIAAINNDNHLYKADSYVAFTNAFAALGQKDFNTEDATQQQVDDEIAALQAARNLLEASDTKISGETALIGESDILTLSNTSQETTPLMAEDGGANISELKFYDVQGNEVTNPKKSIGTGYTVSLVQGGVAKITKTIIVYGDINGDGQVTLTDIRLAKQMAVSLDGFTDAQILAAKCGGATIDVQAVIDIAKAV